MSTDHLLEEFPESEEDSSTGTGSGHTSASGGEAEKTNWIRLAWDDLVRAGLGESVFRIGTQALSVVLVLVAIWAMRSFYSYVQQNKVAAPYQEAAFAAVPPTATPRFQPSLPPYRVSASVQRINRMALLHTTIPTRPRTDVLIYVVEPGDTIFGIAEKFGLKPETILWGNTYTLGDDPHNLRPDQELVILPVDGTYHRWSAGEGLNGVAKGYNVTPEDILSWPGNKLDPNTLGDWANPNIEPGTMLIVPGGKRAFVTWTTPRITRSNPGTAKILGPGFCGTIMDGAVGSGAFIWPSGNHWLSGYDFAQSSNHYGIDIAGQTGDALYASDSGVIVYSGLNNYGYGYVVVIDHGNGWQTLYAHLSAINVGCGQSVYQGDLIGAIGSTGNSTGPHLHFEMMNDAYGKVNPWNFLPAP